MAEDRHSDQRLRLFQSQFWLVLQEQLEVAEKKMPFKLSSDALRMTYFSVWFCERIMTMVAVQYNTQFCCHPSRRHILND